MAERVIQTAFSAGELSPKLYARVDLEKYGSGAALLRNFYVDYRGGASNRAGTKFIGRAKSNATGDARLIPFIYSTDRAYILEVGNQYIRFITNEAYLTETPTTITGITAANPAVVTDTAHGYSTGNEVEIEGVVGMTEVNGKNFLITVLTVNTYSLHDLNGNAIDSTGFTAYTSGGTAARVYTLASPYTTADLPLLKYTQDANTLTFVHHSLPPYDLTRTSSTSFTLTQVVFGPKLGPISPILCATVNEANDHSAYSYTVTGVNDKGEEGFVSFPTFIATAILNQTTNTFNTITWAPLADAVSYRIYKAGPWAAITGGMGNATPPNVTYGFVGTAVGTSFIDVNIAPDYSQTPPTFQDPISPGQIATFSVSAVGTGYTTTDWLVTITATGGGGNGFLAYGLIDPNTGEITSTWLVDPGSGYVTLPTFADDGANSATYTATLGPDSGTYPAAVGYYQQRRFYGGTDNLPESFFASQTGAYNNFDTNTILLDSDAISASIASRQVNAIKSFTSMPTGLVILTTGGGFLVSGGGGGTALTPTAIVALQQPSSGCNDLPPLVVNQDILYCQNRGFVVRDLAFSFYTQSYLGTDRSVLASHLFENFLPVDWTYAEQPYRQILTVRSDGRMLAFTYVPEQEMFAWSSYDTQGEFLSVASIPEGDVNAVYVLVKRHVVNPLGGECWVNYVERMDPRLFDCLLEAWFLDCALQVPHTFPDFPLFLSTSNGVVTAQAFDPCLTEPGGTGPFSSTIYTMTAEENYPSAIVAEWNDATQPDFLFCDKQYIGTSYDRVRRNIMYSSLVSSAVRGDIFPNFITEQNSTGHTLWGGLVNVPPDNYIDLTTNFVMQVAKKNVDSGAVTFYDCFDPTKVVPVGIGAGGITGVTFTGGSGGVDGVHHNVALLGSDTGVNAFATLTISGGVLTTVDLDWGIGFGFLVGDALSPQNFAFGATVTVTSVNTGSDGTWRRSVFDTSINGGDVNGVVNPRTGDFWVHLQSCELALFRVVDNFALVISPLILPFGTAHNGDAFAWVVGLNTNWVYFWSQDIFTSPKRNALQIIPTSITPAEVTADYLLATYTYEYPDNTYFFRQSVGSDGNLYVFGAAQSGTRAYKLWKCVPGTGFTEITPWSASTGPNTNCADWTGNVSTTPWVKHYVIKLPATGQLVCISKLFPQDFDPSGSDPLNFRVDMTYFTLAGGAFDYHEGVVVGYMNAAWVATNQAGAAWRVLDFREMDNDLECSDYVHAYDYTKRWFMFVCNAMSGGSPVDSKNKCVFVQYAFMSGAVPSVVQVVSEQGWDAAYPDYATAVGQTEVVAASLPELSSAVSQARFTNELAKDNGFYDPTANAFWLSGDNPQFCQFATEFNVREDQSSHQQASSPFLKLTFASPSSGQIIQAGCTRIAITGVSDTWTATGTLIDGELPFVPDDPSGLILPITEGGWSLDAPVADISGLDYLEGKIVWALADGVVRGPFTVADGSITLPVSATNIIVGLKYQSQLKTLELDVGSPTIQGKRKQIAATTARLDKTVGLKAGRNFTGVVPMKECAPTTPPSLFSADARTVINAAWDKPGQVCYQQDLPLPVTILGVIPEVVVGDTGK